MCNYYVPSPGQESDTASTVAGTATDAACDPTRTRTTTAAAAAAAAAAANAATTQHAAGIHPHAKR
jgi:hypothetical protein